MDASSFAWIAFASVMAALLGCDLFFHRGQRQSSRVASWLWFGAWLLAGLGFGLFVWAELGAHAAHEYLAAYAIEKSLSLDNLLVFLLIFQALKIPPENQHKALSWGVLGALVLRAVFVVLGASALERWDWVGMVFGAILALAAIRAFRENPAEERHSRLVNWLSEHLPVTTDPKATSFFARENGAMVVTPLLVAVVSLELTDLVFAIDSVPAALSVSHSRFIVYSSNAFAILGLRTLYVIVAREISHLRFLHYGLGLVLGFAAAKLVLAEWVEVDPLVSVGLIVTFIGGAVAASLLAPGRDDTHQSPRVERDAW